MHKKQNSNHFPKEASRLAAICADRAAEFEQARRLPDDVVDQLRDLGMPRLFVPEALAGPECPVPESLVLLEHLAYGDGAVGWCSMITATTSLQAGFLEPTAAEEIFGEPRSIACGVAEPRGLACADGTDLVVSGTWSWGSFSFAADWIAGGCRLAPQSNSTPPETRFVFVPRAEVELVDNWRASGLRATGSCDFQIDGAQVPLRHSTRVAVDPPQFPGALYRFPALPLLALGVAAVALGLARRGLDELGALASGKHYVGSQRILAERPSVRAEYAQLEAAFEAARSWLMSLVDESWSHLEDSTTATLDANQERHLRLAATHATRTCVDLGARAVQLAGGSAIYDEHPLQRVARDLQVIGTHGMIAQRTWELFGRLSEAAARLRQERDSAL